MCKNEIDNKFRQHLGKKESPKVVRNGLNTIKPFSVVLQRYSQKSLVRLGPTVFALSKIFLKIFVGKK